MLRKPEAESITGGDELQRQRNIKQEAFTKQIQMQK